MINTDHFESFLEKEGLTEKYIQYCKLISKEENDPIEIEWKVKPNINPFERNCLGYYNGELVCKVSYAGFNRSTYASMYEVTNEILGMYQYFNRPRLIEALKEKAEKWAIESIIEREEKAKKEIKITKLKQ